MFLIIRLSEEGICSVYKTEEQGKAESYMLREAINICLEQFGSEDFCELYAEENYADFNDDDYEVEYFDTFDELRDNGLLNDFCEYLYEQWNVEFGDNSCLVPIYDDEFLEIKIINTDDVDLLDFAKK